jgi:hypothetical protein
MLARTKWWRGLGVAVIASVALSACEDTVVNVPPQPEPPATPITITITPAQLNLTVGQTQQVVATVTGGAEGTSRAVTYSSSNAAVATVSATGVVTAVAEGAASIIATATADATVRAAAGVNVTTGVIPPTEGEAQVTIQAVTQGGTLWPVNPDDVSGQIDVALNVERGPATSLVVLLNDQVVPGCTQNFGTSANEPAALTAEDLTISAQSQNIVCAINTARYTIDMNTLTATTTYPNATYTVRAELREGTTVLDAASTTPFQFDNVDIVEAFVASTGYTGFPSPAIGSGGFQWHAGDITFHLVPVTYSAGAQGVNAEGYPARATLSLTGEVQGGFVQTTREVTTRTGGGFVVTFPGNYTSTFANGTVHRFNTGQTGSMIQATTVTNAGQPGASSDANRFRFTDLQSGTAIPNSILRVDNEAPDAGSLALTGHPALSSTDPDRVAIRNGWINAAYTFAGGKAGQTDMPFSLMGVGLHSTVTYHASTSGTASLAAIGATAAITSGAQLEQSLTNSQYRVVAKVVDLLGNTSYVQLTTGPKATGTENWIGADFTIPLMTVLRDVSQYNPGMDDTLNIFRVRIRDQAVLETTNFSGPAVARIRAFRFRPSPTESQIDSVTTAGTTYTQKYMPDAFAGVTDVTHEATTTPLSQAYWMFDGFGWDRAGNAVQSMVYSRIFIKDITAPAVSNVNIPIVPLFAGGTAYTFSATATDNVDLNAGHFGYDFADGTSLPVQRFAISPWHRAIMPSYVAEQQVTYVRSLEMVVGDAPSGTRYLPEWVRVRVWDHSHPIGRHSTQMNNLVANTVPAVGPSYTTRGVVSATLSDDGRTFTVAGQTGTFVSPFNRVYFVYQAEDPATAELYWRIRLGSVSTTVEDLGTGPTGRRWIFTLTPAEAIPGETTMAVVGINATGEALLTQPITTPPDEEN